MELKNLLSEKRSAILGKWFDAILSIYPAETSNLMKNNKNQFTNPAGHTILHSIEKIFEELLEGRWETRFELDNILRIKAVQDFTPSEATQFIFHLKKVIREELKNEIQAHNLFDELLRLESQIDRMALLAFDIFMKCREKIYELKAKGMTSDLLMEEGMAYRRGLGR